MELVKAIVSGDDATAFGKIDSAPSLAAIRFEKMGATRQSAKEYFFQEFGYIYRGQTALHVAAAIYRVEIVKKLIGAGANVRAADRLGAQPIHLAAMGTPGSMTWNPSLQSATIACLVAAGADPNARDKRGVTPLHRAVRTRCAAAVESLLDHGSDPRLPNGNGSTPLELANWTTGRGGSGSPEAREQQARIVEMLLELPYP